jgi:hypothetical protein
MLAGYAPAPTPPPGSLSATPAPTTEAGYSINPAEETFCGVHCFSQGGGKAGDAGDAGAAAEDWGSRVENPKVGAQRVQGASGMHPLVCPFSSPLGNGFGQAPPRKQTPGSSKIGSWSDVLSRPVGVATRCCWKPKPLAGS